MRAINVFILAIALSPLVLADALSTGSFLQTAETADCRENAGALPRHAKQYEECPGRRLSIAMDTDGRELFTVQVNPDGGFVLIDHSNGHEYPFFYSAEKGTRDKLLFLFGHNNRGSPIPGNFIHVHNR